MKGDTASGMKQSVQWHNKPSNEACKPELISHRDPNKVDSTPDGPGHYSIIIKYI